MSIICRHRPEVKPTRRTSRKPGRFGAGLLSFAPHAGRVEYTPSDAAWWAAERSRAEDRHYDAMAGESEATARHEMGLCC